MSEEPKVPPVVQIVATVAGCSVAIVALVCIFAKDKLLATAPIVGVLAVMGIVLGFLARRKP